MKPARPSATAVSLASNVPNGHSLVIMFKTLVAVDIVGPQQHRNTRAIHLSRRPPLVYPPPLTVPMNLRTKLGSKGTGMSMRSHRPCT